MTAPEGLNLPTIFQLLTNFAPLTLAESWDNVGLLIKPVKMQLIRKVLLTIDLTDDVMQEALEEEAQMIISYHPPLFNSFKRITNQWKDRIAATCLENRIAVYSPHTSWDSVKDGLNDWLAKCFDCESIVPISPYKFLEPGRNEITHSMSIKCPTTKVDELNLILNKTSCYGLFSSSPQNEEGYHKYDILCSVKELRNYKQFLEDNQCEFEVKNQTASKETLEGCGSGRICRLKTPIPLSEAVEKVKKHVNLPHLRLALAVGKTKESKIRSIALVAGSGASALRDAYADLYLTGEMLHHDILAANHRLTSVILINHSDSERGFLKEVAPRLESIFQNKVVVHVSKKDKDPLITV